MRVAAAGLCPAQAAAIGARVGDFDGSAIGPVGAVHGPAIPQVVRVPLEASNGTARFSIAHTAAAFQAALCSRSLGARHGAPN